MITIKRKIPEKPLGSLNVEVWHNGVLVKYPTSLRIHMDINSAPRAHVLATATDASGNPLRDDQNGGYVIQSFDDWCEVL